jgi:hypothetical protein
MLAGGAYTVKKGYHFFPSPARMSLTKLSQGGNNFIIPDQVELVSDILAGDTKNDNLFYSVSNVFSRGNASAQFPTFFRSV